MSAAVDKTRFGFGFVFSRKKTTGPAAVTGSPSRAPPEESMPALAVLAYLTRRYRSSSVCPLFHFKNKLFGAREWSTVALTDNTRQP